MPLPAVECAVGRGAARAVGTAALCCQSVGIHSPFRAPASPNCADQKCGLSWGTLAALVQRPELLPFLLSFLSFILFSPAGCTTPQLAGEQSACSWCTAAMCPAHLRISSYICSPSAPHHLYHRPASVCKLPQRLQAGRQHTCRLTSSSACPCLLPAGQPAGVRAARSAGTVLLRLLDSRMGIHCPVRTPGVLTMCMLKILTG